MAATVSAYCARCGEGREADAQTGRCMTCGKLATTHLPTRSLGEVRRDAGMEVHPQPSPSAAYRTGGFDPARNVVPVGPVPAEHAAPPFPATSTDKTRFSLPSSGPTRKWLEQTRALGQGLSAAAIEAEKKAAAVEARVAEQVAAHRAAAVRLRNSARVIAQLLEQVGIEAIVPVTRTAREQVAANRSKWWSGTSKAKVDACIDCSQSDRPHKANGRCGACDYAWRKGGKVSV